MTPSSIVIVIIHVVRNQENLPEMRRSQIGTGCNTGISLSRAAVKSPTSPLWGLLVSQRHGRVIVPHRTTYGCVDNHALVRSALHINFSRHEEISDLGALIAGEL